jgi:superfamily II helicase
MMGNVFLKKSSYNEQNISKTEIEIEHVYFQEPHSDFILNETQYFHNDMIKEWSEKLKIFFPLSGEEYHYIIKLLWRGVGIYINGLPDQYLRLIQTLASNKQLGVVFSDKSLIYGVSMPFKSVGIVYSDNLTTMTFQQMCGRAGRRGLDKEGNIIYINFPWEKIKEYSTSLPPTINIINNNIYTFLHANCISALNKTNQSWDNLFIENLNPNEDKSILTLFLENLKKRFLNEWKFSYLNDINHLHMNWRLRYSNESITISYLIPFLKKAFEDKDHTQEYNQINIAHFLCYFINTIKSNDNILKKPEILNVSPYNNIIDDLKRISIDIDENIDKTIFIIIQNNKMIDNENIMYYRDVLLEFGLKIKNIQHYCYHSKFNGLCKLLGKLLTRIMWIYYTSSPLIKPL